jgi:hypothetical protein
MCCPPRASGHPSRGNLARTAKDNPLPILGKRPLPIFIAGTVLALSAQVIKMTRPGSIARDQFMLAYYLEWRAGLGKRASRVAVQPLSISATVGAK